MSGNLFDLSGKGRGKTKPSPKPATKDDVFERIETMQKRHHELVKQLEETYQKSGVDPKELSKYCQNPDNFTDKQWEQYKERKEQIETSITGLSPEKLRKSKESKAATRVTKERRGKTLGARKNWLNMH